MTPEQRKEALEHLTEERNGYQQTLSEMRKDRVNRIDEAFNRYRGFLMRIGELSFIFGAAIGPVLIASKTEIKHPVYVFLAIAIYLLNGFIVLLKMKDMIEADLNQIPRIGQDLEADLYPITYSINKVIWDIDNKSHIQEYLTAKRQFIEKQKDKIVIRDKVSFLLDLLVANFVWASLLLVRVVWPFSMILYWGAFALISLLVITVAVVSYVRFRENRMKKENEEQRIKDLREEQDNWQKREVFKQGN